MRPSIELALFLILGGFTSCDPAYRLVVNNPSGNDVKIRIVYNNLDADWHDRFLDTSRGWGVRQYRGLMHPVYDHKLYLTFYDSSDKFCVKEVKRAVTRLSLFDSVCKCISFILPAKENVVLEGGLGIAPCSQKISFNDADTVDVPHSKNVRRKSKLLLGGTYFLSSGNY